MKQVNVKKLILPNAERAASALNRRLLQRNIPGMGETAVTGYDFGQWASAAKRLLEHEILKQFDLLEYKDRHPLSLSGGQKQRVAIASAIVSNREIIVFDEPTSGLDLKHMWEVARSLKSLADQGKTLLVITHDPELVMAGCSYVVHMEKGQIKESYPLDESGSKKVLDFFRIRQ